MSQSSPFALRPDPAAAGPTAAVIVATALGFVLVQLDVSIVNVALATIGNDLHSRFADLQWIVDAYTVAFAACLLSAGAISDRIGARRTFVIGFVLFICSSIGCALAPSAALLVAARALQGVGAAILVPCSLALLNHAAQGNDKARAHAVSVWTAAGSCALAAGPIIGGLLVATTGWRSIFFVNVPLGVIGIWLTLRAVSETPARARSFDLPGQVAAVVFLGTLTAAVIFGGSDGWTSLPVLVLIGTAIASGIAFGLLEARGPDVMLPLEFFRRRPFSAASIIGFAINFTLYGLIFVLGLYLQRQHGYSPLQTGIAFLPFCVALGVANLVAGRLTAARGARLPMTLGLILAAVGFIALLPLDAHTPYVVMLAGLIVAPIGIGLVVPAMTTALLGSVEKERSGIASGVLNTVRQAGGALGVAVFGSLFAARDVAGMRLDFGIAAALLLAVVVIAVTSVKPPAAAR
jgi:DHA2 family methylenomycin A resistance protein-like MFS transporter